jgi:Galactose oxidase-like, Early set domain
MSRRVIRFGLAVTAALAAIASTVGYETAAAAPGRSGPAGPSVDPALAAEARRVSDAEQYGDASYRPGYRTNMTPMVVAAVTGTPAQIGQWQVASQTLPGLAVHATPLPGADVRFLLIRGSGNNGTAFRAGTFETYVWNVTRGTVKTITTPTDMFCAGHSFLANGNVLIVGGTSGYPTDTEGYLGAKQVYAFDPVTETYRALTPNYKGHWYPTVVTDGYGRPTAVSGLDETGSYAQRAERYLPSTNTWQLMPGTRQFPTYPGLILTAKGQLFYTGSNVFGGHTVQSGFWTLYTNAYKPAYGLPAAASRNQAASVLLYPAQRQVVMTAGGGGAYNTTTNSVGLINMAATTPAWVAGPSIAHAKMHIALVNLPNGELLQANGGAASNSRPVLDAQIYSPFTNKWRTVASPTIARLYHSEAVLAAEGKVYTFGSNPAGASPELRIEVYSPPYLFQSNRPSVTVARTSLHYGGRYGVTTWAPMGRSRFILLRPSAATHSNDPDQRAVDVPFTVSSSTSAAITLPSNPNVAPPGWYMLTLVDTRGVPSRGVWIQIT